jgi:hypothetical protein
MTVSNEPSASGERERSLESIVYHLVLTAFAGVIVVSSLGLRSGPRLVPLVVGVPTLIGMLLLTIGQVVGHRAEPDSVDPDDFADLKSARLGTLAGMAAKEVAEDNALPTDPESARKRRVFVVWAILVLAVAWFVNFYVAMTVGLITIYRYSRIGWVKTLLITGVTVGTIYGTFDLMLGVRF